MKLVTSPRWTNLVSSVARFCTLIRIFRGKFSPGTSLTTSQRKFLRSNGQTSCFPVDKLQTWTTWTWGHLSHLMYLASLFYLAFLWLGRRNNLNNKRGRKLEVIWIIYSTRPVHLFYLACLFNLQLKPTLNNKETKYLLKISTRILLLYLWLEV